MSARGPREAPSGWHLVKTTEDLWKSLGEPDDLAESDFGKMLKRYRIIASDYHPVMRVEAYGGRMYREDIAVLKNCNFIFRIISWKADESFVEIEKVDGDDSRATSGGSDFH